MGQVTQTKSGDQRIAELERENARLVRLLTQADSADEKLRASEERLRLAFGAAGLVGIWDMDLSSGIIRTNARFAELFSISPELGEAGTSMAEYLPSIHPDDRSIVEGAVTATLERGEPYHIEYRVLQPNGDVRWVLAHGSRTATGPDGQALRFTGVVVEITDRKKIEARQAALVELGDRLRESDDTAEMAFAAAELMGRTLGLSRAGYGTVDPERGTVEVERDWTAPGIASIAGPHRFEEYGDLLGGIMKGEVLAIEDVERDPRTASDPTALRKVGIRALLNAPIMEHGRLVAVLFLHDSEVRHWSADKLAFIHGIADRTRAAIERRRAEDQQALLLNELQHRVKNTLSMVQAIASQTFRETATPAAREAFTARLVALSQANDVLTKAGWSAAPLRDVVTGATIPHCAGPERFTIKGPAIEIAAKAALSLTLALHELCTNAAKYGALSNEDGHVVIDWDVLEDATFRLRWAERGGPLVHKPTRTGFGTRLIERSLGPQLRGEVKTDFDPAGITCTVEVPLASVQVAGTA
jgi:PAS domain S-box-containing protein